MLYATKIFFFSFSFSLDSFPDLIFYRLFLFEFFFVIFSLMVTYGLINLTYLYHYHVVLTELELVTVIVGISGQEAFKSGHVF